jgi:hypothetical protein
VYCFALTTCLLPVTQTNLLGCKIFKAQGKKSANTICLLFSSTEITGYMVYIKKQYKMVL